MTQDHTGSNVIEFTSPNTLIGYNNETTEFGLRQLTVTPTGVVENAVFANYISGFAEDILYSEGRIYATNGRVIDVSGSQPFLAGTFANVQGRVVADTAAGLIVYVEGSGFSGDTTRLTLFDPLTFLVAGTITVAENVSNSIYSAISWGACRYAFNTAEGKLVIIDGCTTAAPVLADENGLRLFPNPAADQAFVQNPTWTKTTVRMYTLQGVPVGETVSSDAVIRLDLSATPRQTLIVEIRQAARTVVRKLVRQ